MLLQALLIVERPLGPSDPHAAGFEASCATIAGLLESGKLDKDSLRIMK